MVKSVSVKKNLTERRLIIKMIYIYELRSIDKFF